MSEQWREISGRDGDYEVSNQGRVKSHKRKKPCILRHDMDRFGYHRVVLYENGERRKYQVHRLVAEAFIGPAPSNKHEINHAIKKILTEAEIEYEVPTDYGETFCHFKREYLYLLDKKTTLIIIGDARSNYFNPRQEILGEMREKCRRVIWLNPEPETIWNTGDSEMFTYQAFCHEVRQCSNLNQVMSFVKELVL